MFKPNDLQTLWFIKAVKDLDQNVLSMIEPILAIIEMWERGGFDVFQVFCPKI